MNEMADPRIARLAAELLRMASSEFSNHGCNDFDLPATWTDEYKRQFLAGWEMWNSGGTEEPDDDIPDWCAMGYVAYLLDKEE